MYLGIGLGITRLSGVLGFNPASLFASGEEGAWYDPSDLTTLYQDDIGTTPAGVGDPVGLMLDKSKGGLSATELVTNGDFSNGTTGWTLTQGSATLSVVNGRLRITCTADSTCRVSRPFSTTASLLTHRVTASLDNGTASSIIIRVATNDQLTTSISLTQTYTAATNVVSHPKIVGTTCYVGVIGIMTSGQYIEVDNVSIKELPGNHATQSTPTARPTLQTSGGLYYLDFDGVDDLLSTTFAAAQSQPNTIAAGLKFDQGSRLEFIVDGVGAQSHRLGKATTDLALNAGISITDPSAIGTSERVALGVLNTTSSDLRIDGQSVITGNVGTFQWTGVTLGAARLTNYWSDGRIYGFVGVNRTLTADEIDGVESYLAAKSGVTL